MNIGKVGHPHDPTGPRSGPRMRVFAAAATMAVFMAGCSPDAVSSEGTWGTGSDGAPQLVIEEGGTFSGTDGCNWLAGTWKLNDGTILFSDAVSTDVYCEGVNTWLVGLDTGDMDGEILTIKDVSGKEIGTLSRESDR